MKKFLYFVLLWFFCCIFSQNYHKYSVQNAHSHNDYKQEIPFWLAYRSGLGSIEVDVFYRNNTFMVAHEAQEISANRTLENLYLEHISTLLKENKGKIYKDDKQKLMLLIDMKEGYETELSELAKLLERKYQNIIQNNSIQIVITGKVPPPDKFKDYPEYFFFDGNFMQDYTTEQLRRIGMYSANFRTYTQWGGKGILKEGELAKIKNLVEFAHRKGKKIRFWAAPDFVNAWINLINIGVDFINTDHIQEITVFLNGIGKNFYKNQEKFQLYRPYYQIDGKKKKVKNIILMIPDGVSLPQYYAAFTANKGNLNLFTMKSVGLSKTTSANAYITDSAPGATSFATGIKSKNNFVGVDKDALYLTQLPDILSKKGVVSGIISTGDIADATPAAFYAHTDNRDDSKKVISDFISSNVKFLIGGMTSGFDEKNIALAKRKKITLSQNLKTADFSSNRLIVTDQRASENFSRRGKWLIEAFDKTLYELDKNKAGFFLMIEASRTDINAHENDLGKVVQELLDFDEVVGQAIKFADNDKETLVIVLGDHETGGLSILDGNIQEGWVLGNYSSNDHTAIPALVFAYGLQSDEFTGFYENISVFTKILKVMDLK